MPKGMGYGLGRPVYPREARGVNADVDRKSSKAFMKGGSARQMSNMVDQKGYHSVSDPGRSPNADDNSANR